MQINVAKIILLVLIYSLRYIKIDGKINLSINSVSGYGCASCS